MSTFTAFTQDHRDALQEVTNIAMGQAASQLAGILDTFVQLSVPRIQLLEVTNVGPAITKLVGEGSVVTAVRQAFQGQLVGEAIVIYDQTGCKDLADLMGYEEHPDLQAERELLIDVSNVLVGACLCGIGDLLKTSLSFSLPSLMAEKAEIERLIDPEKMTWNLALLVEVNFSLEARDFVCHLMTMMPESSILSLVGALDEFIESF